MVSRNLLASLAFLMLLPPHAARGAARLDVRNDARRGGGVQAGAEAYGRGQPGNRLSIVAVRVGSSPCLPESGA